MTETTEESGLAIDVVSFAYAGSGTEASGGDKIFVEFAKRWARENTVSVFTTRAGRVLCQNNNVHRARFITIHVGEEHATSLLTILRKTIRGSIKVLRTPGFVSRPIVYSSSDFWPDVIPALIIRRSTRGAKWVTGLYLFAPNPFRKKTDADYRGRRARVTLRNVGYFFSQRIIYEVAKRSADFVLVANELDKRNLVKDGYPASRVKPIYGGVDLDAIDRVPSQETSYDGCFVGRLHPQKGPLELIQIWKNVCRVRPDASLALIGEGPLNTQVRASIKENGLDKNIKMMGWVDGERKYRILKSSRIFLHTPVSDTGGMAAAEGMACGLPVVAFDLPGYQYAYPRGMIKIKTGDTIAFAKAVIDLLDSPEEYQRIRNDAISYSREWDWNVKASEVLEDFKRIANS